MSDPPGRATDSAVQDPPSRRDARPIVWGAIAVGASAGTWLVVSTGATVQANGFVRVFLPMSPNTALCFVLVAATLAVLSGWEPPRYLVFCRAAAAVVILLALARLAELASGWPPGVDGWFFPLPAQRLGLAPAMGRMSPFTAISHTALGLALIFLSRRHRGRRASRLAAVLALGVAFVGLVFCLSFFFTTPAQQAASGAVPVALPTALGFLLLGSLTTGSALLAELDERRRLREQLQRERDLFERIMANSPVAKILMNAEGTITYANSAVEQALGVKPAALLGRRFDDSSWNATDFSGRPLDVQDRPFARVRTTRQAVRGVELAAEMPNGRRIELAVNAAPLLDRDGRFEGVVLALEDISARRRHEAELRRAKEDAELADRAKSGFLATMSHELRTPLNAIIGFSEVLIDQRFGQLDARQSEYLSYILSSGRHLLELINDVLDLSKVASGKVELEPARLSVAGEASAAVSGLRALAEAKGIALQLAVPAPFPDVRADAGRLRQIFYNLLSNATKFTPAGGSVTIAAAAEAAEGAAGSVRISVTDTGRGIRPEDQDRIFGEFEQVREAGAGAQEGTGLGLALTRRLVELHGGRLWVESAGLGKGATFLFTLPLWSEPPAPAAGKPLVLVVEDEPYSRELLTHYLTAAGYAVATAADGEEALRLARELMPQAITLDVLLPGKDGWEVLAELKDSAATRDIPVLVVSITEDRQLGLSLGAVEFLVKPAGRERLVALIHQAVSAPPPRQVLIVDDDAATHELLTAWLTAAGFEVLAAWSGVQGVRLAVEHAPHLIVLDLVMPEMDGFEVVYRLRSLDSTRRIPILIYTVKDLTPEDRARLNSKVQGIAVKSATAREDLLLHLDRLTGRKPAER